MATYGIECLKSGPVKNMPLPGIDRTRTDVYQTPFFGAKREYGPEDGWTTVHYRRRRAHQGSKKFKDAISTAERAAIPRPPAFEFNTVVDDGYLEY